MFFTGSEKKTVHLLSGAASPAPAVSEPTRPPSALSSLAPRLHFIDGLRGLAMLMVLLYHCWLFGGKWALPLPLGRSGVNLAPLLGYGHIGVNLFLVLSGFCLYWPFVKSGRRSEPTLWEFAKKRCRRILPPYYAALLLFAGLPWVQAIHHHQPFNLHFTLVWLGLHLLLLHNLSTEYVISVNGSLWTLALEFQLYLLFPVLVEAYRRFPARGVLLSVFAVCTVYRCIVAWGGYTPDAAAGFVLADSVFGRCFEFALGMFSASMLARWHVSGVSPLRWTDAVLPVLVTVGAMAEGGTYSPLTDAAWGVLFAGLLLAASRPKLFLHRMLSGTVPVSLGVFSYSVYLVHLPLVMALGAETQLRHFSGAEKAAFQLFGVVPLMLLIGYVFHRLFERPFMASSSVPLSSRAAPTI